MSKPPSGDGEARAVSNADSPRRPAKKDLDGDQDDPYTNRIIGNGRYDSDDAGLVYFGRPAAIAERRAARGLIERYYTAAVAGSGARACGLIYSIVAESIPEDYGQPPGPPSLRGRTCSAVMSKVFKQRHRELTADLAKLHVVSVRVKGDRGLALMGVGAKAERRLALRRERGVWKIDALLDAGLP